MAKSLTAFRFEAMEERVVLSGSVGGMEQDNVHMLQDQNLTQEEQQVRDSHHTEWVEVMSVSLPIYRPNDGSIDDFAAEEQQQEAAMLLPAVQKVREASPRSNGADGEIPIEEVSFNYGKIKWVY